MRIFRYWTRIERVLTIDGKAQKVHAFGGSNVSPEAAAADAERRLDGVRRKILGERGDNRAPYEADIREEVLERLDERNVVTRNRYGAAVLNSSEVMFVDIDEPRLGFWDRFRAKPTGAKKIALIEEQVRRLVATAAELRGLGVRLCETHSGVRAIVTGRPFDPKSEYTAELMALFNADLLYSALCRRQGCFRARLTPKPFRIKCRTRKIVFPRDTPQDEEAHRQWVAEYDQARGRFATCRLLCSLGHDVRDSIVAWHDRETGATSGLKLG